MQTSSEKRPVRGFRVLAFAGLASIIALGTASAQQAYQPRANQYYGLYQQNPGGGPSAMGNDNNRFDRSGTRGREGLGASPYHPEGPGNATD
jgi:hypothetical protein